MKRSTPAHSTNVSEAYWSVGGGGLTVSELQKIRVSNRPIRLSNAAHDRIVNSRQIVERLAEGTGALYGINTGFGVLAHQHIPRSDLEQLQENLILSHAVGVGDEVPSEIARLMLLLKAHGLALGYSGARVEIIDYLIRFYNEEFIPIIFTKGSLGASGDLAPLAHLTLPALGFGEVDFKSSRIPAKVALQRLGLEPLRLKAKEGLALIN
ncbi:MAG TPA: aromatic amino acid lyase, partial [Chthoniobacterales bacterium]|nr:aromatic amino acid lyase [Chthoniobacterales bacterium]